MSNDTDENILMMGSFTLCPRSEQTMLTNGCLVCEFFNDDNGKYTCRYDETADSDIIRIVDLITLLLGLVEGGRTHMKKHELVSLLLPDDD